MAILRPSSDLVTGGWTSSPSGTLASCIDETTASDADYIETTGTGNSSIILLGSGSDPGNDNNHKLNYRASSTSETLNVDVVQMAPQIVTSKQPWRRQPQTSVGTGFVPPHFAYNAATGFCEKQAIRYNTSGVSITKSGVAVDIGSTIGRIQIPSATLPAGKFIAFVAFSNKTNQARSDSAILIAGKTYWSQANGFMVAFGAASEVLQINGGNSSFPTVTIPGLSDADGKVHTVAVLYNGTSAKVACDGVSYGDVTIGAAGSFPSGVSLGNYAGTANSNAPYLNILCGGIVPGHLDYVAISRNPYQIFHPLKKVSYFDAPNVIATRTPSLTSSPADYSIDLTSGEAATITDYTKLGLRFRT